MKLWHHYAQVTFKEFVKEDRCESWEAAASGMLTPPPPELRGTLSDSDPESASGLPGTGESRLAEITLGHSGHCCCHGVTCSQPAAPPCPRCSPPAED